jgi:hypothetical protein
VEENKEEEAYQITPKGIIFLALEEASGETIDIFSEPNLTLSEIIKNELVDYMRRFSVNGITLIMLVEGGELVFRQARTPDTILDTDIIE